MGDVFGIGRSIRLQRALFRGDPVPC